MQVKQHLQHQSLQRLHCLSTCFDLLNCDSCDTAVLTAVRAAAAGCVAALLYKGAFMPTTHPVATLQYYVGTLCYCH